MRLRILDVARDDLHAHIDYLLENASQETAEAFEARFIHIAQLLLLHPLMGTSRDNLSPGMRSFSINERTLLFYRILPDDNEPILEIVRVLGARQNLDDLF